jgi:hypothetical protein
MPFLLILEKGLSDPEGYADRFFSYIQCCHDNDTAKEQCYSHRDGEEGWLMRNFSSDKMESIFQIV